MASLSSIVDLVHPTVSGIGVITTDQIWVLFDRELDESTIQNGNFFVAGPDFDTWSGPDLQLYLDTEQLGDEDEILQSPGYHGFVDGTIHFEHIDLNSLTSYGSNQYGVSEYSSGGLDTVGSGFLYRTKAVFTPTSRLQSNTEYRVYLSGDEDETDSLTTGISSKTIFDTVTSGANAGNGDIDFTGSYIGFVDQDTYRLEITTSGEIGDARFTFHTDSDPDSIYGPFKAKRSGVLLSNGVTAEFSDGLYRVGDQWSVIVKERDVFTGNFSWPFKTGSGSIEVIPETTATSVIGDPISSSTTTSSTSTFSVSSTSPANGATNQTLSVGDYDVTVTFNSNIDPTTVIDGVDISVFSEPATGDTDVRASGILAATSSVSGQDLTITITSGQLFQNNLVTVTLDSSIENTSGVSLSSDYEFSFSTQYYPMYCSLRRLRLMVGAYISDIADDTINLAIHVASLESELLTWNKDNLTDEYYVFARSQWTCCRATQILLMNTASGSGTLKSKQLGDLKVEYNTNTDVSKPLANAEECMFKWEGAIMAGGRQVQTPTYVVKGELDIDRPPVGRGWLHTRNSQIAAKPISNERVRVAGSRRYRGSYVRSGWWRR